MNFTRRVGFRMSEHFRKIDEDFGGSISWNIPPNCRVFDESYATSLPVLSCCSCFFNMATALLSPFFLDFLLGCSSTWRCAYEHFSQSLHPFTDLWNKHSGGCHFSQNELVQVPLRRHFPTWASAPGTSGSRCISHTLLRRRSRRRIRLC